MLGFFKFAWLCIKEAWRGCWTKANELATVLGGVVLTVILFSMRGWLTQMNWIDAPTTIPGVVAFGAALAVASVIAAFLVIFSGRLVLAPARLYWDQHEKVETLEAELSAIQKNPDDVPDWPIREVFYFLEPEVLDRPQENLWQKAGDKIRDALSLGRLRIWGRPSKTKLGDWVGPRAALRPIEKTYWEKAYFTYIFLDPSAQDKTDCYADRDTGRPAYADLQVNRAEVLKIWPGEPDDLATDYANVRVADSPDVIELFNGRDRTKLIGLLQAQRLTTWARLSASPASDLVRVDGGIWSTHAFRFIPIAPEETGTINQTYLRPKGAQTSTHYDVCLNYAQLKRAWPDLKIIRSACDIR